MSITIYYVYLYIIYIITHIYYLPKYKGIIFFSHGAVSILYVALLSDLKPINHHIMPSKYQLIKKAMVAFCITKEPINGPPFKLIKVSTFLFVFVLYFIMSYSIDSICSTKKTSRHWGIPSALPRAGLTKYGWREFAIVCSSSWPILVTPHISDTSLERTATFLFIFNKTHRLCL